MLPSGVMVAATRAGVGSTGAGAGVGAGGVPEKREKVSS